MALIGNLFATQPLGREITIYLARHLLQGHKFGNPEIVNILKNTVIHVIPVIDIAFEKIWGDYPKEDRRSNQENINECNNVTADFKQVGRQILEMNGRINGNTHSTIANAFKHILLDGKFDFVLNFEGGNSGMM